MSPAEWIGAISGSLTAAIGLGAIAARAEQRARRLITRIAGDGEKPGLLGRMDNMETTVAEVQGSLAAVAAQLSPNSGGSLHDMMVRVDDRTLRMEHRLDDHISSPHPGR